MTILSSQLSSLTMQYEDFYARGQYASALEIATAILQFAEENQSVHEKMYAHLKLMQCYYSLGEIENALDYIIQFRVLGTDYRTPKTDYYLQLISGYIFEYEENYPKAVEAFRLALTLAIQLNEPRAIALSRNLYAHLLLKNGENEKAHKYALQSYTYIQENLSSHLLYVSHSQHILATTYTELNQTTEALKLLEELKNNPIIVYNKKERSRYLFAYGCYYLKLQQYEHAITFFKKSEEIAFQNNDFILLKRIYKLYATIYSLLHDYRQAYTHMQNYAHLLEQTLKMSFVSKTKELDLKHNVLLVERTANIDLLSGLYNRSYLEKTTNEWLNNAKANGDHVCCITFDVDNFKTINDTYGHLVGDEVIKHIGQCCRTVFPMKNVLCARYGGDEFVVILKNFGKENIRTASQTLFKMITTEEIKFEQISINLTVSMGVVCNEVAPSKRFTQLFRIADQALYMAKRQGKNQILAMTSTNESS